MQLARTALADLIDDIERQEQAGRSWRLTATQLQRILGLSPERYYQDIYGAQMAGHPLIDLSLALEPFSQASAPSLVAVLEHLCGAGAESALERAGVFFSHEQQAEVMADFLTAAAEAVRRHQFQDETFTAMLRTFGRFPEARQVYLDHFFDIDDLQERAARRYCAGRVFTLPIWRSPTPARCCGCSSPSTCRGAGASSDPCMRHSSAPPSTPASPPRNARRADNAHAGRNRNGRSDPAQLRHGAPWASDRNRSPHAA